MFSYSYMTVSTNSSLAYASFILIQACSVETLAKYVNCKKREERETKKNSTSTEFYFSLPPSLFFLFPTALPMIAKILEISKHFSANSCPSMTCLFFGTGLLSLKLVVQKREKNKNAYTYIINFCYQGKYSIFRHETTSTHYHVRPSVSSNCSLNVVVSVHRSFFLIK